MTTDINRTPLKLSNSSHIVYLAALITFIVYPFADFWNLYLFYLPVFTSFLLVFMFSFYVRYNLTYILSNSIPLILLFFILFLSSFWGISKENSLNNYIHLFVFTIFYMVLSYMVLHNRIKSINSIFLSIPVIYFFLNIYLIYKFGSLRADTYAEMQVLGSYSNHMAGVVEICLPFILLIKYNSKRRLFINIIVLITILNIVFSGSRGAFLILLLTFITMPLVVSENPMIYFKKVIIGFVIFSFVIALLLLFPPTRFSIMQTVDRSSQLELKLEHFQQSTLSRQEDDINKRTIMYVAGYKIITEYPVYGIGYRNFSLYTENAFGVPVIAHNVILNVWTSAGIFGVGAMLFLLFRCFKRLKQNIKKYSDNNIFLARWYKVVGIAFVLLLFHGMFRPLLTNPILYLVLAIILMPPSAKHELYQDSS